MLILFPALWEKLVGLICIYWREVCALICKYVSSNLILKIFIWTHLLKYYNIIKS